MSSEISSESVRARLIAEHDHAIAQRDQLESEYALLLGDPDAIQEDRDNIRTLLEAARSTADTAQQAVARLDDGSYGRCAKCGQPIGDARLDALPDTDHCVNCG